VLPGYIDDPTLRSYLPVLFGVTAVLVAATTNGVSIPGWVTRASSQLRAPASRSPITARFAEPSATAEAR
jgi:hypothetical protein